MNTKDLTVLSIGVGIVLVAYFMKKRGFEGFQNPADPTMGAPTMGAPMPQPPMGEPPAFPGSAPMGMPPGAGAPMPPMAMPPMGMPPMAMPPNGPQPQPQPIGMQPNQQQLMDIAQKVQKLSSDQSSISAQLQQITQSFMKEGFQSHQNPYNVASPGDTQAMEFRLDKKALVDSVMRY
jgi:hypothetical protein